MKKIFLLVISASCIATNFAQQSIGKINASLLPSTAPHYQNEYDFDVSANPSAWNAVSPGLHASFGSTEELYFRKEVPFKVEATQKQATAWKGERINFQLLVWSADTLEQVRLNISNLSNEIGKSIDKQNINAHLVRYVLSNYPYGAKDAVCGTSPYSDGYLMPDRFETFDRFDLPGKTARPIWMSVQIPADAEAGTYKT